MEEGQCQLLKNSVNNKQNYINDYGQSHACDMLLKERRQSYACDMFKKEYMFKKQK